MSTSVTPSMLSSSQRAGVLAVSTAARAASTKFSALAKNSGES